MTSVSLILHCCVPVLLCQDGMFVVCHFSLKSEQIYLCCVSVLVPILFVYL